MIQPVSKALESLYEGGGSNYARTSSHELSAEGVSLLSDAANRCGVTFYSNRFQTIQSDSAHAHEVQRPTSQGINQFEKIINLDPYMLGAEDFCLREMTKQLLASGADMTFESPDLTDYPEWMQELDWKRPADAQTELLSENNNECEPGFYPYASDKIALGQMIHFDFGRPSTIIKHAKKFADRNLYDPAKGVTDKAIEWCGMTPSTLLQQDICCQMEQVFDDGMDYEDLDSCVDDALDILKKEEKDQVMELGRNEKLKLSFSGKASSAPPINTVSNNTINYGLSMGL